MILFNVLTWHHPMNSGGTDQEQANVSVSWHELHTSDSMTVRYDENDVPYPLTSDGYYLDPLTCTKALVRLYPPVRKYASTVIAQIQQLYRRHNVIGCLNEE